MRKKEDFSELVNHENAEEYKHNYEVWKKKMFEQKVGYLVIFQDFRKRGYLNIISGGALKLYLFLGMYTDNYTGECWVTIKSAAEYFDRDTRTISIWIDELEKLGLITRIQFKPSTPAHTYMLPY